MSDSGPGPSDDAAAPCPPPAHWEADVALSDGRTCRIRPINGDDHDLLTDFHNKLSEESLYTRFFTANPELSAREVERLLKVDHKNRVGLVALANGEAIGIAVYDNVGRAEAEVAFTVADDHQGRGLGSVLLEHLAAVARENGIHRFRAEVLSGNKRMLGTFEAAGYTPSQQLEDGIVQLDFDIDPTVRSREVARAREHRAEALSISRLVSPRSVAVVCDDLSEGSPGLSLVNNLVSAQFVGRVYVVSPDGRSIASASGAKSLREIGRTIDLVVMALPPDAVEASVPECAECGVRGIVLVTGNFLVGDNYARQSALADTIREHGMRLVGPNALGVINTDPAVQLNASLVADFPGRGRVGFFCQTGAFGGAILTEAHRRGLGVSTFISAGNRADVSANDSLQYWQDDDATAVCVLYLESIGNPRKFARIARRLARIKPVIVIRSGRSSQVLPLGHAVRNTELPPAAIDAMFEQSGVIQVDSMPQSLDTAALLSFQPLPTGNRVGFVSDSDSLGVLTMDATQAVGLEPVTPVRVVDSANDQKAFARHVQELLNDPGVDALVVAHAPQVVGDDQPLNEVLRTLAHSATKPILVVMLADTPDPIYGQLTRYGLPGHGSVPVFPTVDAAVNALSQVVEYAQWRRAPRGVIPRSGGIERQRAHSIATEALGRLEEDRNSTASNSLSQEAIIGILASYGIDVWPSIPVTTEAEAAAAAEQLGYPVVLKSLEHDLVHRMELGAVRLSLENEAALRTAYMSMISTMPDQVVQKLVVQRMAPPGVVCAAATVEDPLFGPALSFRVGGELTSLLGDIAYRIPPLTDEDAKAIIRGTKASELLLRPGIDGQHQLDLAALEDLLERLGQLADDLPEVSFLELNPIVVHEKGVAVLQVDGQVARPLARTDLESRRLA